MRLSSYHGGVIGSFQGLVDRRIRPWVNKKIIEYIGEEEMTLTDFICSKVRYCVISHSNFQTIHVFDIKWDGKFQAS